MLPRSVVGALTALTLVLLPAVAVGPASAAAAPASAVSPAAAAPVRTTTGCLRSVPDPGTSEPVKICWSMFRPAGATRRHQVPMIVQSHGWGGSRTTDPTWLLSLITQGYGVLSFDQRGFGESGGQAQVMSPRVEGRDIRAVVRLAAKQRWVLKDAKGDPRIGAMGGSYGGGFQLLGGFSIRKHGRPVFDALAPEYTWFDLEQSIAPSGVVRTQWATFLAASSLTSQALPPKVLAGMLEGAALGTFPDGSVPGTVDLHSFFERNGSRWQLAQGRKLDVPVLLGQGLTDTLFDGRQALANWHRSLTDRARRHSILIGYDGGHTLPAVTGTSPPVASDPCSKRLAGSDFLALTIRFFDEQLKGRHTGLRGYDRLHLGTPGERCITIADDRPTSPFPIDPVVTPTVVGAPVATKVAAGPISVAGSPTVTATVTTVGLDSRVFYGLAVGTSAATATLVQNNVLPLRVAQQVTGRRRTFALPTVAVDVPAGQSLYLLAAPTNEVFAVMGSRTPGLVTLDDVVVNVPVVGRPHP